MPQIIEVIDRLAYHGTNEVDTIVTAAALRRLCHGKPPSLLLAGITQSPNDLHRRERNALTARLEYLELSLGEKDKHIEYQSQLIIEFEKELANKDEQLRTADKNKKKKKFSKKKRRRPLTEKQINTLIALDELGEAQASAIARRVEGTATDVDEKMADRMANFLEEETPFIKKTVLFSLTAEGNKIAAAERARRGRVDPS